MHGLDVEGLLAVPALRVALSVPPIGSLERSSGVIWLKSTGGWPWVVAYGLASCWIVGDANASMIATVWPWPSMPPATVALVP